MPSCSLTPFFARKEQSRKTDGGDSSWTRPADASDWEANQGESSLPLALSGFRRSSKEGFENA